MILNGLDSLRAMEKFRNNLLQYSVLLIFQKMITRKFNWLSSKIKNSIILIVLSGNFSLLKIEISSTYFWITKTTNRSRVLCLLMMFSPPYGTLMRLYLRSGEEVTTQVNVTHGLSLVNLIIQNKLKNTLIHLNRQWKRTSSH